MARRDREGDERRYRYMREFGDEHLEHSCRGDACQRPHVHVSQGPYPAQVPVDYRGRGPKGYRRSDERIREDVCDALTDDPEIDASEIEVDVEDGTVTLSGAVSDRRQKRLADFVAERPLGVRDVHNRIRLRPEAAPERTAGSTKASTVGDSAARGRTRARS